MAITKRRLLGHDGVVAVREARTAQDAPAAGDWTPDNRNAGESGPDEVILDAREWQSVRVTADFYDGSGDPVGGGNVDVVPLLATRETAGTTGRRWKELPTVSALGDGAVDVPVDGHMAAFRLAGVVLGGATNVVVKVTGGTKLAERVG